MRVIAGEYKGRRLKAVSGKNTRPTSDKIKESVFHMLGPYFQEGRCLDLFAGSGSLGIEALSRGMHEAVFVDRSSQAVRTIKENVIIIQEPQIAKVYCNDALSIVRLLTKKQQKFDLILIDPPYDKIDVNDLLQKLNASDLANKDALLYVEYRISTTLSSLEGWNVIREKAFNKTTKMSILQKT